MAQSRLLYLMTEKIQFDTRVKGLMSAKAVLLVETGEQKEVVKREL